MPDNPLKKDAGNKIRALSFLKYFQSKAFQLHFVSEYFWGQWNDNDILAFEKSNLAFKTDILKRKASKKNLLLYFFFHKLPNFFFHKKWGIFPINFTDKVTIRLRREFNSILRKNEFDYIFINYASWSTLIEDNPFLGKAQLILDTHDLLSAQQKNKKHIGTHFQEEMRRVALFDKALAISIEEQYIFEQFSTAQVSLAPMMMEKPVADLIPLKERTFDIIYVASKNPHNITAANWFIKEVYPLLPESIKICIIGQINEFIAPEYTNVTRILFAEELHSYYQNSRIAICPMLSGTGTKIKVIEAISYSLPVVCNSRGIDGLINKINNGCLVSDTPEGFKNHILSLLNIPEYYQQQSLFANQTFANAYELGTCYKNLDQLF